MALFIRLSAKPAGDGKDEMDVGSDHDLPNENDDDWDEPQNGTLPEDINEDLFDEFYKQAVDEVNESSYPVHVLSYLIVLTNNQPLMLLDRTFNRNILLNHRLPD